MGNFLSNFSFRLIFQLCSLVISTEHFNIWIVIYFLEALWDSQGYHFAVYETV